MEYNIWKTRLKKLAEALSLSLFSSLLWEVFFKPLIGNYPAIPYLDSYAFGVSFLLIYTVVQRLPIDPNPLLDIADRDQLKFFLKQREKYDKLRMETEYNSDMWNNHTEKMTFIERRINHFERRLRSRQISE